LSKTNLSPAEETLKNAADAVEQTVLHISNWLRTAFEQFLSSESGNLMEIDDLGEFKAHAIDRFREILHAGVKTGFKNDPTFPEWARGPVAEAWNVPRYD
jgi:hypothetical protein